MAFSGDVMVYETQKWLNTNYSGKTGYTSLDLSEDGGIAGKTGWTTIYALTKALQIELGITQTANNFGPTTERLFINKFPNGVMQQSDNATSTNNIYGIIQGALWCKGYSVGASSITTHFYSGTGNAIKSLKNDMGIDSSSSTITLNVMKALLSMDQFVIPADNYGKDNPSDIQLLQAIRNVQKTLNHTYESYIGLIPCDGIYGRAMNLALIKVLQAIEGYSIEDATGNFGSGTKSNLPILPDGPIPEGRETDSIQLFRYCLTCNGYMAGTSPSWDSNLETLTRNFQTEYLISVSGKGDVDTWMSLLLSKGNTDRAAAGCDCSEILDVVKANALYNAGYRYVGRYLTGTVGYEEVPKNMTRSELEAIFAAGLRVFAIFQEGVPSLNRYTYSQGMQDAKKALLAAQELGIPQNELIYFAIDYDVMDGEISSTVIPYFMGIRDRFALSYFKYGVGIYGARNVCSRVCDINLAESSFVSDMSTGFSGNMGYRIPSNWAFDQFYEYMFYYSKGAFALDKDAVSGKYNGFNRILPASEMQIPVPTETDYQDAVNEFAKVFNIYSLAPVDNLWATKFEIDLGALTISFESAKEFSFTDNPALNWNEITISNGALPVETFSASATLFNTLDASIKADCGIDTLEFKFELARTIGNGKLYTGLDVNPQNELEVYYRIEKELWTNSEETETYKVYIQVKYTFKNIVSPGEGAPEENYDYSPALQLSPEKIIGVSIVICLIGCVVVGGILTGGTAAPVCAAAASLIAL